jgi:trans-aconitate 2-methyltransferase
MSWDPAQYAKFADLRLRPALDLLGRVPVESAAHVVDLGCGTGNVTEHLAARWPTATIVGVDGSPEMLAEAKARRVRMGPGGHVHWQLANLREWHAGAPVDVLFSNAALHWLGQHDTLFPALFAQVAPAGVMAVQMPRNFDAPSHRIVADLAASSRWSPQLGDLVKPSPVHPPAAYFAWLTACGARVAIWETEYLQPLRGPRPVLEWIKGTYLRPLLDRLSPADQNEFEGAYAERAAEAYPADRDGVTLFPFRRLFLIATR